MTPQSFLVQLITVVLGAGLLRFIIDLVQVRRAGKREKHTLAPEVDGIVAKGAESAVLSMGKSLEAAERRIGKLEEELARKEAKIDSQAEKIDAQAVRIDHLEEQVAELEARVQRPTHRRTRAADGVPPAG